MNDLKQNRFLTIVAAVFLVGFSFYLMKELQSVLLPFFIAVIVSFLFEPYFEWLKKKHIPGGVAILIVVITIVIISNITSVFVLTSINSFTSEIPKYTERTKVLVANITNTLHSWGFFNDYLKESLNLSKLASGEKVTAIATDFFASIVSIFGNFILVLIYVIFLLSEFGSIRKRVLKAFSAERSRTIANILTDIFTDVKKYVVGKTLINLAYGAIVTIILWSFGVDFFIVWGFLAFMMAFIPNIGSLISTFFPFLTALIQFEGDFTRPIIILVLMIVAANLIGNIVEPKVLGDRLNLSPILLLLSLIFWGYLWGLVGMILSVPIMSMIKIILGKFEQTRPISILMSYDVSEIRRKKNTQTV